MTKSPTPTGEVTGQLIYEVLRLHGRLIMAGDALTADLGLTSARWQMLGTIAFHKQPLTVPDLARILGQSRQSLQRLANEMEADGIVAFADNPGHKRSPFVGLTGKGRQLHEKVEARRVAWTETLAAKLPENDTCAAVRVLASLRTALERG